MSENGATPGIDLEAMTRQWQELMMDGWGKMTKEVVGSDAFAAASSSYLDWALSWQKQMRNNTGQFLDSLEFPKRSDVARISKQVMAVEMRIADMEDRLDKMTHLMGALSEAMQRIVEHTVASTPPPARTQAAPAKAEAPAAPVAAAKPAEPAKVAAPATPPAAGKARTGTAKSAKVIKKAPQKPKGSG
ncbi:hypothetical protein IV102_04750 [bacterium]|nr:hypothetical protein [bacterium]